MRSSLALVLVTALASVAACGGGTNPGTGDDDDGGSGSGATSPDGGDTLPPPMVDPDAVFQVTSPTVSIPAGEEHTYCYYFHTSNTETAAIKKWASEMTPGSSHHVILFLTNVAQQPDGTMTEADCGIGGSGNVIPVWTYSAQTVSAKTELPSDDGTGKPLGMEVPANQAAYIQMHYVNTSEKAQPVHTTLYAYAHPSGTAFTKTAAYVTYNASITIPAGATDLLQSQTCKIDPTAKFWTLSTHSHKQSVATDVRDGDKTSTTMAVQSTDWEHPTIASWGAPSFFSFASGKLTYECTYTNDGDNKGRIIHDGNSATSDEMCMAVGYYFPATTPHICYTNVVIQ